MLARIFLMNATHKWNSQNFNNVYYNVCVILSVYFSKSKNTLTHRLIKMFAPGEAHTMCAVTDNWAKVQLGNPTTGQIDYRANRQLGKSAKTSKIGRQLGKPAKISN